MLASLFFAVTLASGQASVAVVSPQWLFIETATGLPADLDSSSGTLGIAEDALPAKICSRADAYHCFVSSFGFEFAIPKNHTVERKWIYNKRVYCVMGVGPDIMGGQLADDSLIIKSRVGASCDENARYDQSYLYSRRAGLRLLTLTRLKGPVFQLISIDKKGFPHPKQQGRSSP